LALLDEIKEINENARLLIWTGVLFYGIPTAAVGQWGVFYMRDLGMTETAMGLVSVVSTSVSLVFLILGGALADAWGRKRTLITFDFISWILGYSLLAMAKNPLYFFLYAIIWGTNGASAVAYGCLFVESVPPEKRGKAYAINAVLGPLPGLVMPFIGALLIQHFQLAMGSVAGLTFAVRLLYMSVAASVAVGEFIRLKRLNETEAGLSRSTSGFLPKRYISVFTAFPPHLPRYFVHSDLLRSYMDDIRWVWNYRPAFFYWLATAISTFASAMPALAYPLFIVEQLRLSLSSIAFFASASTASSIVLTIVLAPRLSPVHLKRFLLMGFSVLPLSSIFFLMARNNVPLLTLSAALGGFSSAMAGPAGGGYWADLIPNERRAKVSAVTGVMTNLMVIPSQFVGIMLYQVMPASPWVVAASLQIMSLLIVGWLPQDPLSKEASRIKD
jgi:MFS family permease